MALQESILSKALLAALGTLLGALAVAPAQAQTIERVRLTDATLECGGILREHAELDQIISAGQPVMQAAPPAPTAAASTTDVGSQIAGAAIAQTLGSMFGSFGGMFGRSAGQVGQQAALQAAQAAAQAAAQQAAQPAAQAQAPQLVAASPQAVQRANEARARKDFLTRLAMARECRPNDPAYAGKPVSGPTMAQLFSASATPQASAAPASFPGQVVTGSAVPAAAAPATAGMSVEAIRQALAEPVTTLPARNLIDGKLELKGKRFYVAEFRVLFDVGGSVTASTRAGYMPGTNYGATRATINYKMNNVDIAALQAITDRAWEDFKQRANAHGLQLEDPANFVLGNGAVYDTTVEPSRPGRPVMLEKNFGAGERKFMVMVPTGMKLHDRGFAGLGAGNISKRIDYSKAALDGLTISMAVNLAALESSGSGSSILRRDGSSVNASEGMQVVQAPDAPLVQTHVNSAGMTMGKPLSIAGNYARFREVGGYNTATDSVAQSMAFLSNRAGVAANNSSRTNMEVDLDGPATARLALRGLASVNQVIVDAMKAGL